MEPETQLPGPTELIALRLIVEIFWVYVYVCERVSVQLRVFVCVCSSVRLAGPLHVCLIGDYQGEGVQECGIVLSVCQCLQVEAGGLWPTPVFAGKAQVPAPTDARGGRRAVKGFSSPAPSSGALKPAASFRTKCLGSQEEGRGAEEAKPQLCSQTRWP